MTLAPDYQNCVFGVHQHHRTFLILLLSTFFTSLCFVDQHRKYRSRPVQLISLGRISKHWDSRKPYRYNRFGAQDFKVQQVKRGNTQRCWTLKSKLMQVSSSFIHKAMQNFQVTALGKVKPCGAVSHPPHTSGCLVKNRAVLYVFAAILDASA